MNSFLTEDFLVHFGKLPQKIKEKARKKRLHRTEPIYSIRIGIGWRALGLRENEGIYWFWIGSHAEYDKLLDRL